MGLTTLILCGGRGTRAHPHTAEVPKPLLDVAGRPLLRHVMDIHAAQGLRHFVLAAGFRADLVAAFAAGLPAEWRVDVVDTGLDTGTAGRVRGCRDRLGDLALVTYGDGLGDVDLAALLAFHRGHGAGATVTAVPLPSPFGVLAVEGDGRVTAFAEKPVLADRWINAGFMAFDGDVLDALAGDDLEREALPALGGAGRLYAFRHRGFWRSLDTYKDALELAALAAAGGGDGGGRPPWMPCAAPAPS